MTNAEALAAQSDDTLTAIFYSGHRTVRDGEGNLGGLSAEEAAWLADTRKEMKRRGLI